MCGGCGAKWSGVKAAHCSGCHETFSSVTTFDSHRQNYQCLRPEEVGLVPGDRGWKLPDKEMVSG